MKGQPFYVGQKVIAVDALRGSLIKNGTVYTILSCDFANGYWYVGVEGSHNRLRPTIFAPLDEQIMSFEKTCEEIKIMAN